MGQPSDTGGAAGITGAEAQPQDPHKGLWGGEGLADPLQNPRDPAHECLPDGGSATWPVPGTSDKPIRKKLSVITEQNGHLTDNKQVNEQMCPPS